MIKNCQQAMLSTQVKEENKISCLDSAYCFEEDIKESICWDYLAIRGIINSKVTVADCKG